MTLPKGASIFVAFIFTVLWLTFLVVPYSLFQEFAGTDWLSIALFHSYIFIFYPLFGLVALIAFFRPAVLFTDLYWRYKRLGRLRFVLGFIVAIALSAGITYFLLLGPPRALWEVTPNIPGTAASVAQTCKETGKDCDAGPLLSPMFAVIKASRTKRTGLQAFTRDCTPDPLLEVPEINTKKRQCFVTGQKLDAKTCCEAQTNFRKNVMVDIMDWGGKSQTGILHEMTLPFKTFFILIMGFIAIMLVVWQDEVEEHYHAQVSAMERGLIVGALAMLFWPLMEYAYGQSAGVLYGNWEPGFNFKWSFVVLPWAVIIGVYFLRSRGFSMLSQLGSIFGAVFAAFQYDQVTNFAVRLTGSGAGLLELAGLGGLAAVLVYIVCFPAKVEQRIRAEMERAADGQPQQRSGAGVVSGRDPLGGGLR